MRKTKRWRKRRVFAYGLLGVILFCYGCFNYYDMNMNDLGLTVLGWVKKLKGEKVDLKEINKTETLTMNHQDWTTLLQRHVKKTGEVDYQGFIEDSTLLQKYLEDISTHIPGRNWTEDEQMAYWINAYNAYTVKLIVDHYPLESIKDITDGLPMINSPWDIKFFTIGNVDFDLNTIEHEILRKQFDEPRIHFAINCASFSCPKLRNEAYTPSQLEAQLEDQAEGFIQDTDKNSIDRKETKLSKIFDWYKSDFTKQMDLLTYLEQYSPEINKDNKVEYLEYDWKLNGK